MNTNWCTVADMKRKKLENELKRLGWWFLRHGGNHDVWTNGNRQEPIPRHNDINEKLAHSILRKAKSGVK
jgi:mRNA interferase HicA